MNAKKIIGLFSKARILVIGDLILDEYIVGSVDRISPEAPVPVVWAKERRFVPGGAANVAHNIRALDGKVALLGVCGGDKHADVLRKSLRCDGVDVSPIVADASRHTTLKTRIIAGHQQIVRVDWEHTHALSARLNESLISFVEKHIKEYDALIIEDYGKGVVNPQVLKAIRQIAASRETIMTVDPKEDHFQYYQGATSITPNRKELENAVRNLKLKDTQNRFKFNSDQLFSDAEIERAAEEVMQYLSLHSLLVTLGEQGMRLFQAGKSSIHIPTVAQEVFDVSGAGDTVIATFTLGLASGASMLEAAHIANYAAGLVVGKLGTATTSRQELLARIAKGV